MPVLSDQDGHPHTALFEIYTLRNGTQRPFLEVRLNGEGVWELSNVTPAHLLPLLHHTEAVGEMAPPTRKSPVRPSLRNSFFRPPKQPRSAMTGSPLGLPRPEAFPSGCGLCPTTCLRQVRVAALWLFLVAKTCIAGQDRVLMPEAVLEFVDSFRTKKKRVPSL